MEIIVGGRATGKTHRLVEEALRYEDALVICADEYAAENAKRIAEGILVSRGVGRKEANQRAWRLVIAAGQAFHRSRGQTLFVDNLAAVLEHMYRRPVAMVADNALVQTPQGKHLEVLPNNPNFDPSDGTE